jgi:hypothetical protein
LLRHTIERKWSRRSIALNCCEMNGERKHTVTQQGLTTKQLGKYAVTKAMIIENDVRRFSLRRARTSPLASIPRIC